MPYAESAGANIYFESQGAGDAILFAHGAGGNAGIWFEQVAAFSDRYQCISFDHRTFARSAADPATISPVQFRDDALAVLDAAGVTEAHVVAQSMGGWTALRMLLDVPERVRSVTLSGTPGGLENRQPTESARNLTTSDDRGTSGVMATMSKATARDPVRMQLYQAINDFVSFYSGHRSASPAPNTASLTSSVPTSAFSQFLIVSSISAYSSLAASSPSAAGPSSAGVSAAAEASARTAAGNGTPSGRERFSASLIKT